MAKNESLPPMSVGHDGTEYFKDGPLLLIGFCFAAQDYVRGVSDRVRGIFSSRENESPKSKSSGSEK